MLFHHGYPAVPEASCQQKWWINWYLSGIRHDTGELPESILMGWIFWSHFAVLIPEQLVLGGDIAIFADESSQVCGETWCNHVQGVGALFDAGLGFDQQGLPCSASWMLRTVAASELDPNVRINILKGVGWNRHVMATVNNATCMEMRKYRGQWIYTSCSRRTWLVMSPIHL